MKITLITQREESTGGTPCPLLSSSDSSLIGAAGTILSSPLVASLVDEETFVWANGYWWGASAYGKDSRYIYPATYIYKWNIADCTFDVRHRLLLHRLIMRAKQGEVVDHINGNTLDNRRVNLRVCSPQQNSWNRHDIRGNSKYKGVHINDRGLIVAQIKVSYKTFNLGTYKTEETAAKAYDTAAIKHFGEFARCNFD